MFFSGQTKAHPAGMGPGAWAQERLGAWDRPWEVLGSANNRWFVHFPAAGSTRETFSISASGLRSQANRNFFDQPPTLSTRHQLWSMQKSASLEILGWLQHYYLVLSCKHRVSSSSPKITLTLAKKDWGAKEPPTFAVPSWQWPGWQGKMVRAQKEGHQFRSSVGSWQSRLKHGWKISLI